MINKKIYVIISVLTVLFSSIFGTWLFLAKAQGPIANITGIIYDKGVDTDGDGTFNYLEIGVEINVTDPATYMVQIWELVASDYNYISVTGDKSEHLNSGLQVINISIYAPAIYTSGLNPVNISGIELFWVEYSPPFNYINNWIESHYDVPLSREYLFTEFDSPFRNMETSFLVYPNGHVVMNGALNYTEMEEKNPFGLMHGNLGFKKTDTTTQASLNLTINIPQEEALQYPFNSSVFSLLSEFSDGLLTTTINGSTTFPLGIASTFPFNTTDFVVKGDYKGNMINGNVTVDILTGFPLDDILLDFQGNNTYVNVNGSTTVIFGNYADIGEINASVLEDMLTSLVDNFEGQDPESLYNMTNGILEFTMLNNITTVHNGNATVDFEAEVKGDIIRVFTNMTGQPDLEDLLNIAWSSVEDGHLLLTYAHTFKEADMKFMFDVNVTHLIYNIIPILPDLMPPDEASFVTSLLNTTFLSVNSAQISMNYDTGQVTLNATAIFHDFTTELNNLKNLFLNSNFSLPLTTQQLNTINDTQIILDDFYLDFRATETSMEVNIQGFRALPPLDWINATNFKLEKFLNLTSNDGYVPPEKGEKLKVMIAGGSNATHTIRIFRQGVTPEPDTSTPGGMIWENQTIHGLKDLIFQIGPLDDTPPVIDTPIQTPEIPDDDETVTISVNVTDADTGIPPEGVTLSYRIDGGNWNNLTMSKITDYTYEGTIPGFPGGTYIEYLIIAYDYAGNEAVEDKLGAYYVYTVIPEFPTWPVLIIVLVLIGLTVVVAVKRKWKIMDNSFSQLSQKVRSILSS